MKLIVAGTRTFNDYNLVKVTLSVITNITEIVSGKAAGADSLGEQYAIEHNIPIKEFPADWLYYGKQAGILRNKQMGDYADELVVFWDGSSRGTSHMISVMKNLNKPYRVIDYVKNTSSYQNL